MRLLLLVLVLRLLGPLLFCPGVWSQRTGGGGRFATSLCEELIRPNSYSCTEHEAVTDDGFILGLQNIPSPQGQTTPSGSPPVILMPGLLGAGDNFVSNSAQESLAFVLADAGFDVWIANNRAVQWSHGHQTLDPSNDKYWNWTYDELASYDLKALTEYVYTQSNGRKLNYIGHSQGALMLFAGLTGGKFKTQILGYLNSAVLMAPVTYVSKLTAPLLQVGFTIYTDQILTVIGNGEFSPDIFFNMTCTSLMIAAAACNDIFNGLPSQDNYMNQSRREVYSQYYPQKTSSFNINHFGQSYRTNTFQFYSRSLFDVPAKYDLTTFPTSLPLQLWNGGVDDLADPSDVNTLLAQLPSSNRVVHYLSKYGHADFILGTRAYIDIYPSIITHFQDHPS